MKCQNLVAVFVLVLLSSMMTWSQEMITRDIDTEPATRYTVIERFEPEFALSNKKREQIREERFSEIDAKIRSLDTMNISERKKEILVELLITNPFSPKVDEIFANIEFAKED